MVMALSAVRDWMQTELESVEVHDTTPDLFFFVSGNNKFPFATIVTRDDDFDRFSNLDREGVYRLNFATSKETFQCLFPEIRNKVDLAKMVVDYTAYDTLFPHPVYGAMRWVSVLNPHTLWPDCKTLLARARYLRELRPNSW